MQSSTWAAYRERQGLEARFLTFEDGHVALASCSGARSRPASRRS